MANESLIKIPFFTQRVSENSFSNDGFATLEDAMHWQERGCGIACIRMIINYFNPSATLPNYRELIQLGIDIEAYCPQGWIHQGLVKIAKKYNIKGKDFRRKETSHILSCLKTGKLCIASVSVGFNTGSKGGHLVVVNGYKSEDNVLEGFYVNHPSSAKEYNWENRFIPLDQFKNSFSGNYMSFSTES
ncbi:MAG: hypothetical protein GY793_02140 [Proteobacteria bacterium]|nr:hypothetical protein [Pseudomonadota bacterium]